MDKNKKKEWVKPEITIIFSGSVKEHVMTLNVSGDPGDPPPPPPPPSSVGGCLLLTIVLKKSHRA